MYTGVEYSWKSVCWYRVRWENANFGELDFGMRTLMGSWVRMSTPGWGRAETHTLWWSRVGQCTLSGMGQECVN